MKEINEINEVNEGINEDNEAVNVDNESNEESIQIGITKKKEKKPKMIQNGLSG